MKNKSILFMVSIVALVGLISIQSANAQSIIDRVFNFTQPPEKMIMVYSVSLGTPSICIGQECSIFTPIMYLPPGINKPQYVRYVIDGECLGVASTLTNSDVWKVIMTCSDGYNQSIDLKESACSNIQTVVWKPITDTLKTYVGPQGKEYEQFWCSFKLNESNTELVPAEFSLMVDTSGLSSQAKDTTIDSQKVAGAHIITSIGSIIGYNLLMWQIILVVIEITAIVAGFGIAIGLLPILLKKMIMWVTG